MLKGHVDNPAANTAAVVTIAAVSSNEQVKIANLHCGYTATPTGGQILVESPSGTVIYKMPITAGGTIARDFADPLRGAIGQAVVVTLAAGSGAVVGSLFVGQHL